jgi:ABC-type lipoprotein export system ATPase subunit
MTDTIVPTPPRTVLAQATDLAKRWVDGAGLQPFSFTLSSSELVVVRGRSGSGKSTLLSLLAGWIDPDGGQLVRMGPWGTSDVDRTWRGTAILPQVIATIAELTVTENVALPLRLSGVAREEANSRAVDVLTRLGLSDEVDRAASDTSLGQQQRMALARAAVVEPIVMLADEPTSHQDAGHIATVLQLLRTMVTNGSCIVVASHDHAVADVADRILDLDR